jgi:hypothetical protein
MGDSSEVEVHCCPGRVPEKGKAMCKLPFATLTAVISLSLLPLAPISASGQEDTAQKHMVLGYQDTRTGQFHPLNRVVPEATVAPITGTITVTLHITLKTAVASGEKVLCTIVLLASYSSTTGVVAYTESGSSYASVSGSTATCVVAIPHSWQFPAVTSTDVEGLSGSYSAEIVNPTATTSTLPLLTRSSESDFVALTGHSIFATAPSTFSVNVTL